MRAFFMWSLPIGINRVVWVTGAHFMPDDEDMGQTTEKLVYNPVRKLGRM